MKNKNDVVIEKLSILYQFLTHKLVVEGQM